ncbi:hypothetical protein [Methanobrevibacter oralis]|uniref:SpoVT-AbrB domain-containing protein n=1 Tax=Methanobrevibacter oralis TaxID=66851 RepID=A0A166CG38_METOA|nr:hypothetical protein [Methanobrevibacter oralis]KZX13977.1 hypothetical protein MBORA_02170 [Methanobrevibacter oralis]
MVNILATSKVQINYQTTIPKEIRKNFQVNNNTIIEWSINEKGKPELNFRRRRKLKELKGLIKLDHNTDSVQLKRELYNE